MSNLAIRNRLTVGNVWQGGAVALFDRDYAGVLLDLGNVTDLAVVAGDDLEPFHDNLPFN